jgi:hypothetical protein
MLINHQQDNRKFMYLNLQYPWRKFVLFISLYSFKTDFLSKKAYFIT